jgi:tetratricopeptide (TPR) repeat protein
VSAHAALGQVHERRGDGTAAEGAYRAALDRLPTFTEAAVALSRLLCRARRAREAVALLADLLLANPADLEALFALGHALVEDGRLDQALHAFERLLAFDPNHAATHFYRGIALARLRRYTAAVAAWEHVVALEPGGELAQKARRHVRTAQDLQHIFQGEAA